jgi:hypothetical protein
MLNDHRIPKAELRQIRRHRDPDNPERAHPWLRDYQIAVDQGRGLDAVAILQEHNALRLHDTRVQAMGEMVVEWDRWRRGHAPTESALIVHGPNSDVDLVNELAQRKRLDAGELGEQAIRAVDRDYLLRPGDLVAIRNAAYTLPAQPAQPRPKRIENGQTAIIESVDPERDTLTLLLREPGAEPRLVEVDQARLRAEHGAGKRAAAVRLNYALHTFPAQGATVHGTATLAATASTSPARTSAPTAPTRTGSVATRSGSPPTANATPASAKPSTAHSGSRSTCPNASHSPASRMLLARWAHATRRARSPLSAMRAGSSPRVSWSSSSGRCRIRPSI